MDEEVLDLAVVHRKELGQLFARRVERQVSNVDRWLRIQGWLIEELRVVVMVVDRLTATTTSRVLALAMVMMKAPTSFDGSPRNNQE